MLRYFTIICFLSIALFSACKKDTINIEPNKSISFSTDSLYFDTVFTTIGSSTRRFSIYNKHSATIKISSLKLAGGTTSLFRLNVNGVPGTEFKDLEIRAKDSVWVFADVTVDPQNTNLPFVVKDSIEFTTNGNFQNVKLVAFGQNAIFHKPKQGENSFYVSCDDVWTKDTPHVIYGIALIDSSCTLTIEKGSKVYLHTNGAIVALSNASLKVKGTKEEPVILEGDRLEPAYENLAGQWQGIYLFPLSIDNQVDWAEIKNARLGIQADTLNSSVSSNPTLTIRNTTIRNMSSIGISGRGSWIEGTNCVFANCGNYCGTFSLGGTYNFKHCTFANYAPQGFDGAALLLNNWFEDNNKNIISRDLEEASFTNSIIYGNQLNEVVLSKSEKGIFNYAFKNCLIKVDKKDTNYESAEFTNCKNNEDPKFTSSNEGDFSIKENSAAKDIGDLNTVNEDILYLENDLKMNSRLSDNKPDAGAYEFTTSEE